MRDTMKHRAAVVAEGRRQVRESFPLVWRTRGLGTQSQRSPGEPGLFGLLWSLRIKGVGASEYSLANKKY